MAKHKSLDDVLSEVDKWSAEMVREIEGMSSGELRKHFKTAEARLAKASGIKLRLPKVRKKPAKA